MARALLVYATLLTLLAGPGALGARPDPSAYRVEMLGDVDAAAFPQVTVRFRILDANGQPARELPREDILILEDGKEVERIRPARLKEFPTAVALALDTSGSMAAQNKLAEAKAAANRFFQRLDPQAPCGLVLFHHQIYRDEPPTLDRARLERLVSAAQARGGTAFVDASLAAMRLLPEGPGETQRSVVLMTDGRDVNSEATLRQAIEEAKARKTPIYTLGLGAPGRGAYVRTVLVLDRSGSMGEDGRIQALKVAAKRFIQLMPSEAADTCVIVFSDQIRFLGERRAFTNEKARLQEAIDRIRPGGETRLWDAIYEGLQTLEENRRQEEGGRPVRYAVVVLTDGMDHTSQDYRHDLDVIPYAKRLGIPVHMLGLGPKDGIDEPKMTEVATSTGGRYRHVQRSNDLTEVFEDLSIDLHDGGIDEQALKTLAKETGGEYFHVRDAEKLQAAFEQVAAKVQNTYAVTFRSLRSQPDGTGRSVEVKLGALAAATAGYKTHGLITPQSEPSLYVAGLGVIFILLALPALVRRRRPLPA